MYILGTDNFMSLISELVRISIKRNIVNIVKFQCNYYPNKHWWRYASKKKMKAEVEARKQQRERAH